METKKSGKLEDVSDNATETSPFLSPYHANPTTISIQSQEQVPLDNTGENGASNGFKEKTVNCADGIDNQDDCHNPASRQEKKGCSSYFGIFMALVAGFVFTCGTILVKYMKHYHAFTLALYRFQGVWLPSIFMVLYAVKLKKLPVFDTIWPVRERKKAGNLIGVIVRASVGCVALFLHLYALKYLSVADVAVMSSCKPVFVTVAAFIILGESFGVFPMTMALLTMIGVGVITRPPILTGQDSFDSATVIGAGLALASVVTDTMVVILIRYLKEVHVSIMMLFLGIWGALQSSICAYIVDDLKLPETGTDWALAGGLALTAIINQAAMNIALQFELASNVAVTRAVDFIFAFLLQFIVMGVAPDWFSMTGAAIIILCVAGIAFRKWLKMQPKNHPARKRFWIVLI